MYIGGHGDKGEDIGIRIELTCLPLIAGLLESANSSILAPCRLFKEVVGKKIRILC